MKVFVTKYALTAGIVVVEVEYGHAGSAEKYVYRMRGGLQQFVMGENAFFTYPEAVIAAREMRNKKELSLKKQLRKVSGMIFLTRMPDDLKN